MIVRKAIVASTKVFIFVVAVVSCWFVLCASASAALNLPAPSVRKAKQPLVLAHYMPWFQIPPVKGQFNHWNLRNEGSDLAGKPFDLTEVLPDGRANIGSHFYPLTGPYDTRDSDVLDYQLALMKASGIDGVIFDWYGIEDCGGFFDYVSIHNGTVEMIKALRRAGMKFAVCYEDQTVLHMLEYGKIGEAEAIGVAKKAFSWLAENLFSDPLYVKTADGRPVVLCFGPQFFSKKGDWDAIFEGISPRPFFVDLMHDPNIEGIRTHDGAEASFNWPDMPASGELTQAKLEEQLVWFYGLHKDSSYLAASAFPSFDDSVLKEAGMANDSRTLAYADGKTFRLTLDAAEKSLPDIIQIATWNDYGEGTIIEPTIERGYEVLEQIQKFRRKSEANFAFTEMDLRAPIEFYKLLATGKATIEQKNLISMAYGAIFRGDAASSRNYAKQAGVEYDMSTRPYLNKEEGETQGKLDNGSGSGGCIAGAAGLFGFLFFPGLIGRVWISKKAQ
jgi:hypothetical protein